MQQQNKNIVMVNRILIRLKVVQLLYSFLLTRSQFNIEDKPVRQTRDSVYAHKLYIAILSLITKLGGQKLLAAEHLPYFADSKGVNPIAKSLLARPLAQQSDLKRQAMDIAEYLAGFDAVIEPLFKEVIDSAVFKDYSRKRTKDLEREVEMWVVLLQTTIANSSALQSYCRKDTDFSLAGYDAAITKVVATLRQFADTRFALVNAKRSLQESLDRAYSLYCDLLWLPVQITRLQEKQLQEAKDKYLPTAADLNPNLRFVDNAYVRKIAESTELEERFKEMPNELADDDFLTKSLLDLILASDAYRKYMEADSTNFEKDADFWRLIMRTVVFPSDALAEALESRSVFWNDDVFVMGTFVLKTMKKIASDPMTEDLHILPQFKDEEDADFGNQLFADTVANTDRYRQLAERFVNGSDWDPERMAFMDLVILLTAIAEICNFPKIPVPVTVNEYVEIANFYSTPRSGQFVNGMLYSIAKYLKQEGVIFKEI